MQVILSKRFNLRASRMCLYPFSTTSVHFEISSVANISLQEAFTKYGLCECRTQELVALSGAHTIGNKGFGNPNLFDNSYFQILLQKPWKIAGMPIVLLHQKHSVILEMDTREVG